MSGTALQDKRQGPVHEQKAQAHTNMARCRAEQAVQAAAAAAAAVALIACLPLTSWGCPRAQTRTGTPTLDG